MRIDHSVVSFINRITPYADESLPSVYLRVATANHYPAVNVVIQVIKQTLGQEIYLTQDRIWNPAQISHYNPSDTAQFFDQLAMLLRIPAAQLCSTWLPDVFVDEVLAPPYIQLCPACVEDLPYHRRYWLSLSIAACMRHRRLLIDRCPECDRALRIQAIISLECDRCCYDLRQAPSITIDPSPSIISAHQRIEAWMGGSRYHGPDCVAAFDLQPSICQFHVFDWLRHLVTEAVPTWAYQRVLENGTSRLETWPTLKKATPEQRYVLTTSAMQGITTWPASFAQTLIQLWDVPRASPSQQSVLHNILHSWPFSDPQYAFVWDAFEPLLAEQYYPAQHCIYSDDIAFERPFAYISMDKAGTLFDTVGAVIDHLVYLDILTGARLRRNGRGFISMVEVTALQHQWNQSLSCEDVAEWLGCSSDMVIALATRGLLIVDSAVKDEQPSQWLFTKASVVVILTALVRQEKEWTEGPRPRLVALDQAGAWMADVKIDSIGLIERLVTGELVYFRDREFSTSHFWYHTSRKIPLGIDAIMFDLNVLEEYIVRIKRTVSDLPNVDSP